MCACVCVHVTGRILIFNLHSGGNNEHKQKSRAQIKKNPGVKRVKGDGKHETPGGEKKTTAAKLEKTDDSKRQPENKVVCLCTVIN